MCFSMMTWKNKHGLMLQDDGMQLWMTRDKDKDDDCDAEDEGACPR